MSLVDLYLYTKHQAQADWLRYYLDRIGHEVGTEPGSSPQRVLEAVQSLRAAFGRARGYASIPLNADGHPVAFREAGR